MIRTYSVLNDLIALIVLIVLNVLNDLIVLIALNCFNCFRLFSLITLIGHIRLKEAVDGKRFSGSLNSIIRTCVIDLLENV